MCHVRAEPPRGSPRLTIICSPLADSGRKSVFASPANLEVTRDNEGSPARFQCRFGASPERPSALSRSRTAAWLRTPSSAPAWSFGREPLTRARTPRYLKTGAGARDSRVRRPASAASNISRRALRTGATGRRERELLRALSAVRLRMSISECFRCISGIRGSQIRTPPQIASLRRFLETMTSF